MTQNNINRTNHKTNIAYCTHFDMCTYDYKFIK